MKSLVQRLEEKYIPEPNSGCWIWLGGHSGRYGQIAIENGYTVRLAHRVSYRLFNGSFDEKLRVLHRGDNTFCINPAHLFLGTQADNVKDMSRKRRHRCHIGHKQPWQRFDTGTLYAIASAKGTHKEIATRYGCSESYVWLLKQGKKGQGNG